MTLVDRTFPYRSPPGMREMDALDQVRSVFGIQRISFDEGVNVMKVEYDACRLTQCDVEALLRAAGFAVS